MVVYLSINSPSPIALKIADKVYDNCNEACLFMVSVFSHIVVECNHTVK